MFKLFKYILNSVDLSPDSYDWLTGNLNNSVRRGGERGRGCRRGGGGKKRKNGGGERKERIGGGVERRGGGEGGGKGERLSRREGM